MRPERSRTIRPQGTFWLLIALVVGAALLIYLQFTRATPGHFNIAKVMAASSAFLQQLREAGATIPPSVSLDELIGLGLLTVSDLPGLRVTQAKSQSQQD